MSAGGCTLTLEFSGEARAALRVMPSLLRYGIVRWSEVDGIVQDIVDRGMVAVGSKP